MRSKNYVLIGPLLCSFMLGTTGVACGAVISVTANGASGSGAFLINSEFAVGGAKAFNGLDPIDLTLIVDSAGTYSIDEASASSSPGILNNSGRSWTDFELKIISAPAGTSFRGAGESSFYPAKFSDVSRTSDFVRFSGGEIPTVQGAPTRVYGFDPFFSLQLSGPGTVVVRETPSVPEPGSFGLVAGALVWMVGHWRSWTRRPRSAALKA